MFTFLQRLIDFCSKAAEPDDDQIQEDSFVLPARKQLSEADAATLRLVYSCESQEGSIRAVTLAGSEH